MKKWKHRHRMAIPAKQGIEKKGRAGFALLYAGQTKGDLECGERTGITQTYGIY